MAIIVVNIERTGADARHFQAHIAYLGNTQHNTAQQLHCAKEFNDLAVSAAEGWPSSEIRATEIKKLSLWPLTKQNRTAARQ